MHGTGRLAIQVGPETVAALPTPENRSTMLAPAHFSAVAYVVFTSGSTGQPKGVLVDHRAVSSSCTAHGTRMGLSEASRTLQFSSLTFDMCIVEIVSTLIFGGCVCVPSDTDRMGDLAQFIADKNVNTSVLTPTVSRLIDPQRLPTSMARPRP